MSSGGKNSAKEAKTSTPSDTNTPPGSPGKSVSGVTLSPARKQSFEKGVEMAEKRLYLDSQKPESDSEDNLLYEMPRDPIHDVCFCDISFIFTS